MRAKHTLAYFAHAMEVRSNSHPENTGRYMTGTLSDGTVMDVAIVHAALESDVGPNTGRESSMDRLITKRTQRLTDDMENLKDRLHTYIEQRSVLKWRPPANMAYLTFADRLKAFATWPRWTELPTPESLAEGGFFYEGMYTLYYVTFNTLFWHLSGTTIYTLFHYTQAVQMRLRAFTAILQ